MKKYTFLFAVIATLALVACGSGSTTTETTDSTAVETVTDTTTQKDTTDYKNENAERLSELKDVEKKPTTQPIK